MKNNQTKNPFAIFGTPNKVIVNGIKKPDGEIADCLNELQNNPSNIKAYFITTTWLLDYKPIMLRAKIINRLNNKNRTGLRFVLSLITLTI